jgi:cell shape-determining protein MreC
VTFPVAPSAAELMQTFTSAFSDSRLRAFPTVPSRMKDPYSPTDGELRAFDIFVRQAADFLESSTNQQ